MTKYTLFIIAGLALFTGLVGYSIGRATAPNRKAVEESTRIATAATETAAAMQRQATFWQAKAETLGSQLETCQQDLRTQSALPRVQNGGKSVVRARPRK